MKKHYLNWVLGNILLLSTSVLANPASLDKTELRKDVTVIVETNSGLIKSKASKTTSEASLPILNCGYPINIAISSIKTDEAEVAWTDSNASATWNLEYGAEGFTQGSGTSINVTTNPHTLTGLMPGTKYDLYLQSDCGGGSLSTWVGPFNFKTYPLGAFCNAPVAVTALPFTFSSNTLNFGNFYTGIAGTGCGTSDNYLQGNEVIFEFTPTADEAITINLSGLSDFYAGVFVYEDCADIGVSCIAGAVNAATTSNFGINDFYVEGGETYYIVISTYLSASTEFTIDILPFDCATLTPPVAQAISHYVSGYTLADLDVVTNRNPATISWYSDAAATISIPETTVLANNTTYYATQNFVGCESVPFAVQVVEIDCNQMQIASTTGDMVMCSGIMTLSATSSGVGTDIYWYDAAVGGNLLHKGPQYTTPSLNATTSYWVAEVAQKDMSPNYADLPEGYCPVTTSLGCFGVYNIDSFILKRSSGAKVIEHLSTGCSTDSYGDFTGDQSLIIELTPGSTYDFELTTSFADFIYFKIWIDTNADGVFDSNEVFYTSTSGHGATNPATGSFTVPQNVTGAAVMRVKASFQSAETDPCTISLFGEGHDYKVVFDEPIMCESPRVKVDAVVNENGDIAFNHLNLPYSHSDNTVNYHNIFSGNPGTGCSGSNILSGNEVIYQYTADPNSDDILKLSLRNITNTSDLTGMYIYTSCGNIGVDCEAGGTNANSPEITIENYYVNAGEVLFIVISSEAGTTGYTLNIEGINCANIPQPAIDSPTPYFISGDVLDDIRLDYNTYGSLTWYADSSDIPNNPIVDPTSHAIVNGTTYYVTQTLLNCESSALAVTPVEFVCSNLSTNASDAALCSPGGRITLDAQSGGTGSDVYWYDASTGGNILAMGDILTTDVTTTTSFWTNEIFVRHEEVYEQNGRLNPNSTSGYGQDKVGLIFTAAQSFIIKTVDVYPTDAGGALKLQLIDNVTDKVLITKSFTIPSGTGTTAVTLPLDFPVGQAGEYRLVQSTAIKLVRESSSGFPFPFPLGPNGSLGNITSGVNQSGSVTTYYYFYNWSVAKREIGCESARQEVVVLINDQPTPAPTGIPTQTYCEGSTVADLVAVGTDLKWYESGTATNPLAPTTLLVDGKSYYGTQTVDACESDIRFKVDVEIMDIADKPIGAQNQYFIQGQTVSDLDVQGDNLLWYFDPDKNNPIADPTTERLFDQETYYVSQTPSGMCESELLGIKVHIILGTNTSLFNGFTFYPNPTQDILNLAHNSEIMESVKIYNTLGQEVLRQDIRSKQYQLNVSTLSSGTYLMQVTVKGKTQMIRLIKE